MLDHAQPAATGLWRPQPGLWASSLVWSGLGNGAPSIFPEKGVLAWTATAPRVMGEAQVSNASTERVSCTRWANL